MLQGIYVSQMVLHFNICAVLRFVQMSADGCDAVSTTTKSSIVCFKMIFDASFEVFTVVTIQVEVF